MTHVLDLNLGVDLAAIRMLQVGGTLRAWRAEIAIDW
jgi:hypothetical protein